MALNFKSQNWIPDDPYSLLKDMQFWSDLVGLSMYCKLFELYGLGYPGLFEPINLRFNPEVTGLNAVLIINFFALSRLFFGWSQELLWDLYNFY